MCGPHCHLAPRKGPAGVNTSRAPHVGRGDAGFPVVFGRSHLKFGSCSLRGRPWFKGGDPSLKYQRPKLAERGVSRVCVVVSFNKPSSKNKSSQVKSRFTLLGGKKAMCRGGGSRAQGLVRAGVVPTEQEAANRPSINAQAISD